MGSLTPSLLGTFEKRLNFLIESLTMIRSTGVALRMCALTSKVSYLLLLSSKNVVTRNRSIVFDFKQRLSKPEHTV